MKKIYAVFSICLVVLLLASCSTVDEAVLQEKKEVAEAALLAETEAAEFNTFFYLRMLESKDHSLYLVEYGSFLVVSSLWIGSVIVDAQTNEIVNIDTDAQFYSGISAEMAAQFRTQKESLETEFGDFRMVDFNEEMFPEKD